MNQPVYLALICVGDFEVKTQLQKVHLCIPRTTSHTLQMLIYETVTQAIK